jgi:hypothetical protein
MSGTITFGLGFNGTGKDRQLIRMSDDSGGRYTEVTKKTTPEDLAAEIWRDLRNRYVLGFVPTTFDEKRHTLRVKVKRPAVQIRTQAAYLASERGR